ncbi:MAG: hypothetical protein ACE5HQ_10400 [Gemmatimonadota bacterium]
MDGMAVQVGRTAPERLNVAQRLGALGEVVPPPEIAELWVFPPLVDVDASAEFFLFTRLVDGTRRGVYTARVLPENGASARQVIVEHGSVPANRVALLVDRFQRRLGSDHRPAHYVIEGRPERWTELIAARSAAEDGAPAEVRVPADPAVAAD